MDILNFISWIKGNRVVTTVNSDQTLIPLGLKDPKRDDGYLAGAISVTDLAAQIGGGGIIAEDTGVGSARRIDATNCASGAYSTALGKCNTVTGDNSASLFGVGNVTCNGFSIANGTGNVNAYNGASILSGQFNVIACDALSSTCSGGYLYPGFICGVKTLSLSYGDLTSYYTPGSTISLQNTYGNPQTNYFNLTICGSSFNGTATTICIDPSINTCSGYIVKTGPFSTDSAYSNNVIAGGAFNSINGYSDSSIISGGLNNTLTRNTFASVIVGGWCNFMCSQRSVISGGAKNSISGAYAVIAGGSANSISTAGTSSSISGGRYNTSSAIYSSISGGMQNTVTGSHSGVLGGMQNTASNYKSFIVGSNICSNRDCSTFVNNLNIMDIPTSDSGLPTKSVWFDSATCTLKMVP